MTSCSIRCIGSYRLFSDTPHLHGDFNFTKSIFETAEQSLHYLCRSELLFSTILSFAKPCFALKTLSPVLVLKRGTLDLQKPLRPFPPLSPSLLFSKTASLKRWSRRLESKTRLFPDVFIPSAISIISERPATVRWRLSAVSRHTLQKFRRLCRFSPCKGYRSKKGTTLFKMCEDERVSYLYRLLALSTRIEPPLKTVFTFFSSSRLAGVALCPVLKLGLTSTFTFKCSSFRNETEKHPSLSRKPAM